MFLLGSCNLWSTALTEKDILCNLKTLALECQKQRFFYLKNTRKFVISWLLLWLAIGEQTLYDFQFLSALRYWKEGNDSYLWLIYLQKDKNAQKIKFTS